MIWAIWIENWWFRLNYNSGGAVEGYSSPAEDWLWQGRHLGCGGRAGWASDIILKLKLYTVVWARQVWGGAQKKSKTFDLFAWVPRQERGLCLEYWLVKNLHQSQIRDILLDWKLTAVGTWPIVCIDECQVTLRHPSIAWVTISHI